MTINFPETYAESRERFCHAVNALGAEHICLPIDVDGMSGLCIDVALMGSPELPAVVVSSGLHGVEGPFGAAVQLAWLAELQGKPLQRRYVLVHAMNPYGYAMGRRVNEDNVDLNRNFLPFHPESSTESLTEPSTEPSTKLSTKSLTEPSKQSSVNDYARFDGLLNPARPPQRSDIFLLKALGYLVREGRQQLQEAIVTGQYAYPRGLFYGGCAQSQTVQFVSEHMPEWLGASPQVCHLDFHIGLGSYSRCQLMIQADLASSRYQWCEAAFGASELLATEGKTALREKASYQAHGAMGSWLVQRFADRPYHFVTAEFGTCSALKVLSALRTENQAFHFCSPDSVARTNARKKLEECFCPRSPGWRRAVVSRGLRLIEQASGSGG